METNEKKKNKIKDYSIVSLIVIIFALLFAIIHNNISSKNLEP
jgi:hypothetical protein